MDQQITVSVSVDLGEVDPLGDAQIASQRAYPIGGTADTLASLAVFTDEAFNP